MRRFIATFQEALVLLFLIALTGAGAFSLRTLINHETSVLPESATAELRLPQEAQPAQNWLSSQDLLSDQDAEYLDDVRDEVPFKAPALLPAEDGAFLPRPIPAPEPPPSIRLISEAAEPRMGETFSTKQHHTGQQNTTIELPGGWVLLNPEDSPSAGSHDVPGLKLTEPEDSWIPLPEPFASLPTQQCFSLPDGPQTGGRWCPEFPTKPASADQLPAPSFSFPQSLRSAVDAAAAALGNTGQTQPSQFYLQDDIQFFPSGPDLKPARLPATGFAGEAGHVRMISGTGEPVAKAADSSSAREADSAPAIDDPLPQRISDPLPGREPATKLPLVPDAPAENPATLGTTTTQEAGDQSALPLPAPQPPLPAELSDTPDRHHPVDLPRVAEQFQPQRIPQQLPAVRDAASQTEEESLQLKRLRETVRNGLPGASPTERDVWLEELQGLPHDMARELLQFRRRFGGKVGSRPRLPDFEPRRTADSSLTSTPAATGNDQPPAELPPPAAAPQAGEPPRTLDPGAEGYIHLPPHTGHVYLPGNGYGPSILAEPVLSMAESSRILRNQLAPSLASLQLVERVLLNNIANASTPGFRRSRVVLTPMPAEIVRPQASEDVDGPLNPAGVLVGLGVEVAATQIDHTPGEILNTGRRLDVAIDGEGFLSVITDGEILYTRCGNLTLDNDGCLVLAATQRRYRLEPEIQIPDTAETIRILADGTVQTTLPGTTPTKAAGQIQVTRFLNPDGLEPQGEGVFAMTRAAGRPQTGTAGTGGRGTLRAGALEQSNVRIEEEQQQMDQVRQQAQLIRSLLGSERYSPEGGSGVVERTPEPPRVASQPDHTRFLPRWAPPAPGRPDPRSMPLAIPPSYYRNNDPSVQFAPPAGPQLSPAPSFRPVDVPPSADSPEPPELPLPPDPEEQPIDDTPVTLPLPASLPRILDQPATSR